MRYPRSQLCSRSCSPSSCPWSSLRAVPTTAQPSHLQPAPALPDSAARSAPPLPARTPSSPRALALHSPQRRLGTTVPGGVGHSAIQALVEDLRATCVSRTTRAGQRRELRPWEAPPLRRRATLYATRRRTPTRRDSSPVQSLYVHPPRSRNSADLVNRTPRSSLFTPEPRPSRSRRPSSRRCPSPRRSEETGRPRLSSSTRQTRATRRWPSSSTAPPMRASK